MSRANTAPTACTHAHVEPQRIAKAAGPDRTTAGVNVTNVGPVNNTLLPQHVAPRKTAENDGRTPRNSAPAVVGAKVSPVIGSRTPLVNGTDRTRITAAPPTSTANGNFVSVADMPGVVNLRPGELEHLQAHGVSVGIHNGILSVNRAYVPTAIGLIAQARAGN